MTIGDYVGDRLVNPKSYIKTAAKSSKNIKKYKSGTIPAQAIPGGSRYMGHNSPETGLDHVPCDSGYTRGQGWGLLNKCWIGYKRANGHGNEGYFERLSWAIAIQNAQTDLGIKRASFPQLGLLGDYIFLYDKEQEAELRTLLKDIKDEDKKEELRRQKAKYKSHVSKIVETSYMADSERELLGDYEGKVEKIVLVDELVNRNEKLDSQV